MECEREKKEICEDIRSGNQEVLLLLRSYIQFPCSWEDSMESIKTNAHTLPTDAQDLYKTSTCEQIKERLSTKLGRLVTTPTDKIKNAEIRVEPTKIKEKERCCAKKAGKEDGATEDRTSTDRKDGDDDARDTLMEAESSAEEDNGTEREMDEKGEKEQKKKRKEKETGEKNVGKKNDNLEPPKKKNKMSTLQLIRKKIIKSTTSL